MENIMKRNLFEYLDPHVCELLVPEFVKSKVFSDEALASLRLKNAAKTLLFDTKITLLDALSKTSGDSPNIQSIRSKIQEQEKQTKDQLLSLKTNPSIQLISEVIQSADYERLSASDFKRSEIDSIESLKQIIMSRQMLNDCILYARLSYDTGNYSESIKFINLLNRMVDDPSDILNMAWAKLNNNLVLGLQGSAAAISQIVEDLREAKGTIDSRSHVSPAQKITLACSLINSALVGLVLLNRQEYKHELLFDLFLDERYLSAIQLGEPEILRNLVLLYMTSYEKKSMRIDYRVLVDILKSEMYDCEDPFSRFLRLLYIDFDLLAASQTITAIEEAAHSDLFFSGYAGSIVESCRKMYFEVYCKIYNSLEIEKVAKFLKVGNEEAEIWIINLVRRNNIKATMNAAGNALAIGEQAAEDTEHLNKRSKDLMERNRILLNNVGKILKDKQF